MTQNRGGTSINWDRFEVACKLAKNVSTVMLTGVGEPTLCPGVIEQYLTRLQRFNFPIIELQTNGRLLESPTLSYWRRLGLQLVSLSITHYDPVLSNKLMSFSKPYAWNFWSKVKLLHSIGLSVRLNCTLLKRGIGTIEGITQLVDKCRENEIEQLTLREVTTPSAYSEIAEYCMAERPYILDQYEDSIKYRPLLQELPHGGRVYDVDGQNVCISNCMTTDTKEIRSIIFFPDGAIRYDWQHKGARIL
jgi:hypothetical protein